MELLIIETSAGGHSKYSQNIDAFNKSDVDTLGLHVRLTFPDTFRNELPRCDVLLLGSGLGDEAVEIARFVREKHPGISVLMFTTADAYSGGSFRAAYGAGVRKVIPDTASPLDLLQELVAIHMEFRRNGRAREGRVICFAQAKGGTGSTTICAALGELAAELGKKTMLWDFDVETADLCRSFAMNVSGSKTVSSWLNGSAVISRETLDQALYSLHDNLSFLAPPNADLADAMDFVCHTDAVGAMYQILDLARATHDLVLVDLAGKLGPAAAAVMSSADDVILVIDDTLVGLTGLNQYLKLVFPLIKRPDKLHFLTNGWNGASDAIAEVQLELEAVYRFGKQPWSLPPVPIDAHGGTWAGTQKSLYGLGKPATRQALAGIAERLNLRPPVRPEGSVKTVGGSFLSQAAA